MSRAGFILTGGHSSRMRTDKALLPWRGKTALEYLATLVQEAAGAVMIVGHPERYTHLDLPGVADLRPQLGPLSGIETALTISEADWNLILACDLMDVNRDLVLNLFEYAERTNAGVTLIRDAARSIQPLCAIYHKSCLDEVRSALDRQELRLSALIQRLKPCFLDIQETMRNINTPEEWSALTSRPHT
jgi:molybdopterin-guanine dinucleotide biosynthesis protein A